MESVEHKSACSIWKRTESPQLRMLCHVLKIDDGKLSLEAQVILSGKWPFEFSSQFLVSVSGTDPLGSTFGVAIIRGRTFGEAVPRDRWGSGSGCCESACEDRRFEVKHIARQWHKACVNASGVGDNASLVVELRVERKLHFDEDPVMAIEEAEEMQAEAIKALASEDKLPHLSHLGIFDERLSSAPSQTSSTLSDSPKKENFGNPPGTGCSAVDEAERPLPRPRTVKAVPPVHIQCLELPSPLDRLYLMLPRECLPDTKKLNEISMANLPKRKFAEVLLGNGFVNEVIESATAKPGQIKAYGDEGHFLSIERFAALTCLFNNNCSFLSIGPLEHPSLLLFLKLWSNIEVLEMFCPLVLDDLSVLQSLPKLRTLDLKMMGTEALALGPQQLILRKCTGSMQSNNEFLGGACVKGNVATLMLQECSNVTRVAGSVRAEELQVNKCPCIDLVNADVKRATLYFLPNLKRGIAEMAAQPRLEWLDLQGSNKVPIHELVRAANLLKNRNGVMVWPSRDVVNAAMKQSRDESLLAFAQAGATEKLSFCIGKAEEAHDRESFLAGLAIVVRYAKSMNVNKELIEDAESIIARMQTRKVMHGMGESKTFNNFLEQSKSKLFMQAGLKAKLFIAPKPDTIERKAFISATQSIFGLSESEAQLVYDQVDAEGNGFITEEDIMWLQEASEHETAAVDELFRLAQHLKDVFSSTSKTKSHASVYAEAFDAMAGDDAEISMEEFTEGLRKVGWETKRAKMIFNALDFDRRSGSIDLEEWSLLGFYARCQEMKKLEGLKKHLIEKRGSLKEAWKSLDENKSGGISWEEMCQVLPKLNWPVCEATKKSFFYLDKDGTGLITKEEFLELQGFSYNDFLSQVQHLREEIRKRYMTLGDAFDAVDKDGSGQISLEEWVKECESIGIASMSKIDCRVLYHFLNVSRGGFTTRRLPTASPLQHLMCQARVARSPEALHDSMWE